MRVVLVGGTSGIGRALADQFTERGDRVFLTGRSGEEVERIVSDLEVRHGAKVYGHVFDALDEGERTRLVGEARAALGGIDGFVVTFGDTGDRQRARTDAEYARMMHDINYQTPADLLDAAATYLESQRDEAPRLRFDDDGSVSASATAEESPPRRFIAAIGSVAGDRGRQSNYHYGAAKAALHGHLEGLRHRLYPAGITVLTVKPGLIDTPMTFGREDLVFVIPAERAAREILEAIDNGKHELYTPWFWRWIMRGLRMLPEWAFAKMKV